ncbi:MAG: TonB-dependent receptor [Halieaceae bacterium]|nr:TonB-dependent receptor [Halieaceae bacterium]
MNISNHFKTLAAAVAIVMIPDTGWAQSQLEEIIVTATRRDETVQTVPISITALSADRLKLARVEGVRDLGIVTPGLNMNGRSNAWIPYIRGVGAQDTSGGQEASVSVYIDGVYMSSVHAGAMSFNSIDRVEVLKGPQGTLFGRNSTGGLIHIITRDPGQETQIFGKVGFGDYDTVTAQLYVGGGLTDTLSADIALNYADQGEGYGNNLFSGREIAGDADEGFRTKWIWQASDETTLTWTADYQQHDTGLGDNRTLMPGSVGADGSVNMGGFRDVNMNFPADGETDGYIENQGAMLKIQHQFGWADLVSISSYREIEQYNIFDNDGLPTSNVEARQEYNNTETFTQEIQLLSRSESLFSWIVGAFYLDDESGYAGPRGLQVEGAGVIPIPGAYVQFVNPITTESIAAFAEGTWEITDSIRLNAGVRYTEEEKAIGGEQRIFTVFPDILGLGAPALTVIPFDFDESWEEFTYKVAGEFDVSEDVMLYASYNHGFRSGSFNTVGVSGVPVEPESVNAFEVGIKSQWMDNRLRLNAATYYYDYKDLQVVVSRGPSTDLLNAGEAEISGFELDLEASVSEELTLRFSTSLIDSEYTEFVVGNNCSIRLPDGHTVQAPPCSPEGNNLVRTPESTVNLGMVYRKPVQFGAIGVSLDYFWTDDFYWEIDNRLKESAYGLLNGTVFWESADEHWGITLWGRNLTDEEYSMFSVAQASCTGPGCFGIGDQYSAAPPRTWGVDFNFRF